MHQMATLAKLIAICCMFVLFPIRFHLLIARWPVCRWCLATSAALLAYTDAGQVQYEPERAATEPAQHHGRTGELELFK